MDIKVSDILTFKNNEYLVLDVIDEKYLYLINNDQTKDDIAIVKLQNKQISDIESDVEFDYVINKIYLDYKEEVLSFFK